MKKLSWFAAALMLPFGATAEDIELYLGSNANNKTRPQVLIILDNSGSMNTLEVVDEPYDPNKVYPAVGGLNALQDRMIYFTKGASVDGAQGITPDSPSEARRFLADINSCETARERLDTVGFYTGHIREYKFSGNSGSWQEIPNNNGANIEVIDCEDDVLQVPNKPENNAGILDKKGKVAPLPDGYPVDGQGTKKNPIYHTANAADSNVVWGGEVVTLYTDNYLRWANSTNLTQVNMSRLDIAKDVLTALVNSAPSVDFGLQVFNHNHSGENVRDGGRVVHGIQTSTAVTRQALTDLINNDIDGENNTPLCETLYEAMRYFGGRSVDYGDNDSNYGGYKANTPPRDKSVENAGTYISPYTSCIDKVYVIMITDGKPTMDRAADTFIKGLPNIGGPFNLNGTDNYLAALAGWMNTNDINSNLTGDQTSTLFTIGFGKDAINDAEPLLKAAAQSGGGEYYPANDSPRLLSSLQSALSKILAVNTSFTSPSVASNNYDRTETLDSVYFAMFVPDRGTSWRGNLKKLKISNGKQVDQGGNNAIDSNGNIDKNATTFWTTGNSPDGNDVTKGGVSQMLANKTSRKVLTNMAPSGNGLVALDKTNAQAFYGSAAALELALDVNAADVDDYLDWAVGIDVDDIDNDGDDTDIRENVFGDPLHSKPLTINYGGSVSSQDVRIIVGTNAGALHMFQDNGNTVEENWAFMPNEFVKNYKKLRDNFANTGKVYGIDGPASSYLYDKHGDGEIKKVDGDKAWVFFGLRRGGSSYYAMDVSDPDDPKLMWHIDANTSGFSELGQSWSQPKLAHSALNVSNNVPKPVLIFGAGYDINKDSLSVGTDDSVGRGVFIVDAETGALLWSLTPGATGGKNTNFAGITDSIPSQVSTLDSDLDGLVDRMYMGDTGGNVWRVDMPGNNPFSTATPWTVHKLASLGGVTNLDDRRFFSEPSISRITLTDTAQTTVNGKTTITRQDRNYEAILIGSGDRTNPLGTDTDDKFFMIRDKNTSTGSFVSSPTGNQNAIPSPILFSDLYDFTNNPFGGNLTSQQKETLQIAVSAKDGWFVDFTDTGEKGTAEAIAINGVAYFTSYTPSAGQSQLCIIGAGVGRLYAINMEEGTTVYSWRKTDVSASLPDVPEIIMRKKPKCTQNCTPKPPNQDPYAELGDTYITLGGELRSIDFNLRTSRTYMYVTEAQ